MNDQQKAAAAMAQIRAVYEDGVAEVNGRSYKFHKMQHIERRHVYGYYTSIQGQLKIGDHSFLYSPGFAPVETIMWNAISFNGSLVSKIADHWEEYPDDYVTLVAVAMGVMSYPFLRASGIASASQAETPAKTTSSKPM